MNIFVCKMCQHVEFDSAPEKCPVCGAPKTAFEKRADYLKQPTDSANLTDSDKKHIPQITIVKECGLIPGGVCFDVHVKVGEIEHVMQEQHYIMFIDYYVDKKYVGRISFASQGSHPAGALHLQATSGKVTVIEHCNVHGSWMVESQL